MFVKDEAEVSCRRHDVIVWPAQIAEMNCYSRMNIFSECLLVLHTAAL